MSKQFYNINTKEREIL